MVLDLLNLLGVLRKKTYSPKWWWVWWWFTSVPSLKLTASLPLFQWMVGRLRSCPIGSFRPIFRGENLLAVSLFGRVKSVKKTNTLNKSNALDDSGQIIIFHQPRFPWNKGISLTKPPFGVRSYEVAIIWPDDSLGVLYLKPLNVRGARWNSPKKVEMLQNSRGGEGIKGGSRDTYLYIYIYICSI